MNAVCQVSPYITAICVSLSSSKTVVEQVYQLILRMVDRWNNHDLEGYMASFWKSDDLLTVVESEVHWGWTDLYHYYARGYPDRNLMGQLDLQLVMQMI